MKLALVAVFVFIVSLIIQRNDNIQRTNNLGESLVNNTLSELSSSVSANIIATFFDAAVLLINKTGIAILIFLIIALPLFLKPLSSSLKSKNNKIHKAFHNKLSAYIGFSDSATKDPDAIIDKDENALFHLISSIIVVTSCFFLVANAMKIMFSFDIVQYFQISQAISIVIGIGARDLFMNILLGISSVGSIHVGSLLDISPNYPMQPLSGWKFVNTTATVQHGVVHQVTFTGVYVLLIPFSDKDASKNTKVFYRLQFFEYKQLYSSCVLVEEFTPPT